MLAPGPELSVSLKHVQTPASLHYLLHRRVTNRGNIRELRQHTSGLFGESVHA